MLKNKLIRNDKKTRCRKRVTKTPTYKITQDIYIYFFFFFFFLILYIYIYIYIEREREREREREI